MVDLTIFNLNYLLLSYSVCGVHWVYTDPIVTSSAASIMSLCDLILV